MGAMFAPLQESLGALGVGAVGGSTELETEDIDVLAAKPRKVQAKKFAAQKA